MTKYVTQDNLDKLHPDVRKIADEVVDKMHSKDTYFFDIITPKSTRTVIFNI